MFNPKFDFDQAFERATQIALTVGAGKDVVRALVLREAAVVRMSRHEPFSAGWNAASRAIVEQECKLAPWGLV